MNSQLFGDRYQIGDTLGFGGMSEVHRGRDLRLGRDVAVKVLRADLARDPSFQARFRREAQNAASLNHPAIVAVYDTGETQGEGGPIPYIVMEFVDGETLRDLLKREGTLAPKRAMEITADVCAALDFSHRHGIVHRDIKPANIMLTRAGAVKVMDFGIARAVADGQSSVTATAAVIGTAQYLSPEQARGEAVDARSDVYATGCVLFELLTGAPPFTGDSPVAVAYQHVREAPKPPSEVKPGLPKELDAIVLKALNKNALNRYQTAAEMRADLVRALSGQAVQATPLMTEEERTQLMRATPARVGPLAGVPATAAPLLAPPRRALPQVWEEDEEPDRSRKVWGYVGIGALCVALLAGAIFLTLKVTTRPAAAKRVTVPSVQNLSLPAAQNALTAAGLQLGSTDLKDSSQEQKDKVIGQNPSPQTVVDANTKVDLDIGQGQTSVAVPNLGGLDAADAKAALARVNLVYKEGPTISGADAKKNLVVGQNPAFNQQVPPGATVTVNIGSGLVYHNIPGDLAGKSFNDAKAELVAAGLDAVAAPIDGIEPLNTVKKVVQPPNATGPEVPAGTVVTLQVSNAQLFMLVDVSNRTLADAVAALNAAGWAGNGTSVVVTYTDTTIPAQYDKVISQTPAVSPAPQHKDVTVMLNIGREKKVNVPDLMGKAIADAENALTSDPNNQLKYQTQTKPAATQDQVGKVYYQSEIPGSQVNWDTVLVIGFYGDVPKPTPSPTPSPQPVVTPPTVVTAPPTSTGGQAPTSPTVITIPSR